LASAVLVSTSAGAMLSNVRYRSRVLTRLPFGRSSHCRGKLASAWSPSRTQLCQCQQMCNFTCTGGRFLPFRRRAQHRSRDFPVSARGIGFGSRRPVIEIEAKVSCVDHGKHDRPAAGGLMRRGVSP
jgi:hypothetical protein